MFLIRNVQLFCISSPPHPFVSFIPALLSHWPFFYYLPLFVTVSFTSYIFLPLLFLPLPRLTSFLSFVPPFLHHNHNASLSKVLFITAFSVLSSILTYLQHSLILWFVLRELLLYSYSGSLSAIMLHFSRKKHTHYFLTFSTLLFIPNILWLTSSGSLK